MSIPKRIIILLLLFSPTACNPLPNQEQELNQAIAIINRSIEAAGGDKFNRITIDFDFRDYHYKSIRDNGLFTYQRSKSDTLDILNNEGYERFINGRKVEIPDSMAVKYSNSINSVIYFALLPFGLNDPAVNKEYLGKVNIDEETYHKIKVTFDQEGGGEDFEDIFIYWVNTENHFVDFLAYEYHTEGGGQRFRKANNTRFVNGIRFVDYRNYKPTVKGTSIDEIDSLYIQNKLMLLSNIDLKNITVSESHNR